MNKKRDFKSVMRLIFMGGDYPDFKLEARRHILFLNLVVFIGVVILAIMALKTLRENNLALTYFDTGTGIFLLGMMVYLRISKNYKVASWLCIGAVTVLYMFLLATGGSERTGALWLLTYPFVAIFLVGLVPGVILIGVMLAAIAFFFLLPEAASSVLQAIIPGYAPNEYGADYTMRVFMSYVLSTALAVFYEAVRKSTQQRLEVSMGSLEKTTGDLVARRAETDSIMQNVKEGIFLLDASQAITSEYSRELEMIFEKKTLQGTNIHDLLSPALPEKMSAVFRDYLEMLYAPDANLSLLKEINPINKVELNLPRDDGKITTKHLEFDFTKVAVDSEASQVLGTVRDVTSEMKLVRELEVQEDRAKRQMQKLSEIINVDPALMNEFIADAEEELENINMLLKSEEEDYSLLIPLMYQGIHAVKGNALLLGLTALSNRLHDLEEQVSLLLTRKNVAWQDLFTITAGLGEINNDIEEVKALIEKLLSFQTTMRLSGLEQKNLLLTTLHKLVDRQCRDTGKEANLVLQNFHTDAISPRYRKLVKEVLIQIIRNAIAHGIEAPQDREPAGKPRKGIIQIGCEKRDNRIRITVRDDGKGLNPVAIREKAKTLPGFCDLPLDSFSDAQLMSLIFKPGFSTANTASLAAGRGIGLSMIKKRVEEQHGELKVRTAKGKSTEFEISLPT